MAVEPATRFVRNHRLATFFAAYTLAGVFTFGHAAAHGEPPACLIRDLKTAACTFVATDVRVPGAILSAMGWPLYWSWELQTPSTRP